MITSRNDRFFKGGFIGLMIAAAVFCGASAVACGEVISEGDVKALFPAVREGLTLVNMSQ